MQHQARAHCPALADVEVENNQVYLVRGVAEPPPFCSLVRYDETTRQLYVYQAWYEARTC